MCNYVAYNRFINFVFYIYSGVTLQQIRLSNSIKIGVRVVVADVINHTKFGNDRYREYKVTEGRILACSIGMTCRL